MARFSFHQVLLYMSDQNQIILFWKISLSFNIQCFFHLSGLITLPQRRQ